MKDAAQLGNDAVTTAMDAYLLSGIDSIDGWIGQAKINENSGTLAAYLLGSALIHAAEILAEAMKDHCEAHEQ
jgi:hypothetical protein